MCVSAREDLFKKIEYNRRMNIEKRKNLSYRIVAAFLLLISVGLVVFATIKTISFNYDELVLALVALIFTGVLGMIEAGFILRGWTKESYLYKIVFNDNKKINNVPLIAVTIGNVVSFVLLGLSLFVWFTRSDTKALVSVLVIMSVSIYLLANCLIYYFYAILFKDRPVNLRSLIK